MAITINKMLRKPLVAFFIILSRKDEMTEPTGNMGQSFSRKGHEIALIVEARALDKQRKEGKATLLNPAGTTFTIYCDEGAYLSGDDTAPPPLAYLSSSVAF